MAPTVATTYGIVTAVRDERSLLRQLARCLRRQTVRPVAWQIVDTGSTDGTLDDVEHWARSEDWIGLTRAPAPARVRGPVVATAIEAGLADLAVRPDVLVKVDADVSFEPEYFEHLLAAFERDPRLGIASGSRHERLRARWRQRHVTGTSVEAQCRAYRWACLQDVLPFEKHLGWDGVDEVKANIAGWRTRVLHDLPFRHHRRIGGREHSTLVARWREGEAAHFMGYRASYAVIRSLYRSLTEPASIALAGGFLAAALLRLPRVQEPAVHDYVRRQQSPLRLPMRAAEAVGLRRRSRNHGVGVLLVADSGGHLFELAGLEGVWSRFSRVWVTVGGANVGFLDGERIFYGHGPTARSIRNLVRNGLFACRLVRTLRPAVILTTGAGLSVPFAWAGRALGARVLYVECSGRVGVSLSCRLVAPVAHRVYVQWPEALSQVPRARHLGSIFFSPR